MSTIKERHDVEGGANHIIIFAKTECIRDRYIGIPQTPNDFIFTLDFVCCLGEQLSGGLLPQDKLLTIGGRQLVGWIGLAESKLVYCISI